VLDISDKNHPVLQAQAKAEMVKESTQTEGESETGSIEEQMSDPVHESLLRIELPRVSLELLHHFATEAC
jgi:hypothetical protein